MTFEDHLFQNQEANGSTGINVLKGDQALMIDTHV
jgi:hypothetical protein